MTSLPNSDGASIVRIALLIDADNLHPSFADEMFAVLGELGVVTLRRAYGNFGKPEVQKWHAAMRQHAVAPVHQHDLVAGKNATDIRLAIDAIELVVEKQCDVLAIASSDSDFSPLAIRLRERGVPVIGFAQRGKTAADLAAAFDSFHLLDRAPSAAPEAAAPRRTRKAATAAVSGVALATVPPPAPAATRSRRGVAKVAAATSPVARGELPPAPAGRVAAPRATAGAAPRASVGGVAATGASEARGAVPARVAAPGASQARVAAPGASEARVAAPSAPQARVATPGASVAAQSTAEHSAGAGAVRDWPAEIAAILAAVPELHGAGMALNSASEALRRAGILKGRNASPSRLFKKYPEYFQLRPLNKPETVHFVGPSRSPQMRSFVA